MQDTLPFVFIDWKRFLKFNGVKFHYINSLHIVTHGSARFPALGFRFHRGDFSLYVVVQSIPVSTTSIEFTANTAKQVLEKLEKFQFIIPSKVPTNIQAILKKC